MTSIPFMKYRKVAALISIVLVSLSCISLVFKQLNWGLDFTGGTLVEVAYPSAAVPEDIRQALDERGWNGHLVQFFGSDRYILVRMPLRKIDLSAKNASLGDALFADLSGDCRNGSGFASSRICWTGRRVKSSRIRVGSGCSLRLA